MSFRVELWIPRSRSPNLKNVVRCARAFDQFTEPEDNAEPYHLTLGLEEFRTKYAEFTGLYEDIRNWKGTELRVNGKIGHRGTINDVLTVLRCSNERTTAVLPEDHCESDYTPHNWGCRKITLIREGSPNTGYGYHYQSKYWFEFGRFAVDRTQWILDKVGLTEAIRREADQAYLDVCPFFDFDEVIERIQRLPDFIDLAEDSPWEITYAEEYDNAAILKVPTGVRPKASGEDLVHLGMGLRFSLQDAFDERSEEGREGEDPERHIPKISFDDIGGVDEIIGLVREVIELPLKHPLILKHLGIVPHKGILLFGPPGCGKTLIAKAIANEISAHFISIKGPELLSKWVGESEGNLRKVFDEAREFSPSIIFFDEIDAIAHKRSGEETTRHYSVFVNQLLTLMDGMETYEDVCVLASTNRPELLDEALLRPGRFDYTLEVKKPTRVGCRRVFEIHTRDMPIAPSVRLDEIAFGLVGLTGAEIAFVAREGAYNCLRRTLDIGELIRQDEADLDLTTLQVRQNDFERALAQVGNRGHPDSREIESPTDLDRQTTPGHPQRSVGEGHQLPVVH